MTQPSVAMEAIRMRMRPQVTFLSLVRLLWVGVNIACLLVSISGLRDLSGITIMLSFPASVLAGVLSLIAFDATAWSGTWLATLLLGTVAIASGYVQWFVVGRALAQRMLVHLPARRPLHLALRVAVVFVFVGLGGIGIELVRAQEQADLFFDRAMTVREGMSNHEVRSILGEPNQVFGHTAASESPRVCSPGAVREAAYWYEHHSLPPRFARDSFVLVVCSDAHGRVVDVRTLRVH